MKWVKAHTGLLDNDAFKLLSKDARDTFLYALLIAGKQEQNGALAIRAVGPMSAEQIAEYTRIPVRRQHKALEELAAVGAFMTRRDGDNAWMIAKWEEKAGETSAERTKRYRSKLRGDGSVTSPARHGDALDKDGEVEAEKIAAAARAMESPAMQFGRWYLSAAVQAGCVAEHESVDATAWAYKQLDASEVLLGTYGVDACTARAEALFAAKRAGKIRTRYADIRWLQRNWGLVELDAPKADDFVGEYMRTNQRAV